MDNIFDIMDWELLQFPIELRTDESEYLPSTVSTAVVKRDSIQRIQAGVEGRLNFQEARQWLNRQTGEAGKPPELFELTGTAENGAHVVLRDVYLPGGSTYRGESLSVPIGTPQLEFTFSHSTGELCERVCDWHINGPRHELLFLRATDRHRDVSYQYKRIMPDSVVGDYQWTEPVPLGSIGKDFMLISPASVAPKFIVAKVPEHLGPPWSVNVGIEYHAAWGLPTLDERKAIAEITGFVLGRHLVKVGSSDYNHDGRLLAATVQPALGNDTRVVCEGLDYSPIAADRQGNIGGRMESILSRLVPVYLTARDEFNMAEALTAYWIASRMPLGTSLPMFATAVEIIKHGWYKSARSKSQGNYMDKQAYETLLKDELTAAEKKLNGIEYGSSIINKLKDAYRMSVAQQTENFFKEIELPIGEGERLVMWSRNKMVHAGVAHDSQWAKLSALTHGYRSLFHRVVLRLLKYEGPYVDRTMVGWPTKDLLEPIGLRKSK